MKKLEPQWLEFSWRFKEEEAEDIYEDLKNPTHEEFEDLNLYNTPAKAWESVDVAGSGPYTWSGCEQGRGNVGYKILSLAHAKGVTVLRKK